MKERQFRIAPSILSADFGRLAEEVRLLEEAGADWIHVDVMDGHFVPNITIGPQVVEALRRATSLPLDVHLMIQRPDAFTEAFVRAGADFLTVHAETCPHLHRTLHSIRGLGARPGVAINPSTPLCSLEFIASDADLILLMTVNPGFGGQSFIPAMIPKIASLRRFLDQRRIPAELQVDGGICVDNIAEVAEAGATVFVSGSGILKGGDYRLTISRMREKCHSVRDLGGLDHEETRVSTSGRPGQDR